MEAYLRTDTTESQDDLRIRFLTGVRLDGVRAFLRQFQLTVEEHLQNFVVQLNGVSSSESMAALIAELGQQLTDTFPRDDTTLVDKGDLWSSLMDKILSKLVEQPAEAGCWAFVLHSAAPVKLILARQPEAVGFRGVPPVLGRWAAAMHLLDRVRDMHTESDEPADLLCRVDLLTVMAEQLLRYEANRMGPPPISGVPLLEQDFLFLHVVGWWRWHVSLAESDARERIKESDFEKSPPTGQHLLREAHRTLEELTVAGETVSLKTMRSVICVGAAEIQTNVQLLLFPPVPWTRTKLAAPLQQLQESSRWVQSLCVKFLAHPTLPTILCTGQAVASRTVCDMLRGGLLPSAEEVLDHAERFMPPAAAAQSRNGDEVSDREVLVSVLDVLETTFGSAFVSQDDIFMTLRRL